MKTTLTHSEETMAAIRAARTDRATARRVASWARAATIAAGYFDDLNRIRWADVERRASRLAK